MLNIDGMHRFIVLLIVIVLSGCGNRSNWGIANKLTDEFKINMISDGDRP